MKETCHSTSIFVISSPSATGKSTLTEELLKKNSNLKKSISVTTRMPRKNEINGLHYIFKTKEEFSNLVQEKAFLEYTNIYGNNYGILRNSILELLEKKIDVLFEINYSGMRSIKSKLKNLVSIFIIPPNLEELYKRIYNRGEDNEESIGIRMKSALTEIQCAKYYDYIIVNDDLKKSIKNVQAIILTEKLKKSKTVLEKLINRTFL